MITTETNQHGEELNRVIGVLHKEIERGYVLPSSAIALAGLISNERDAAIARFAELADEIDANARLRDQEDRLVYPARDRRPMHECADAIRRVVKEAS